MSVEVDESGQIIRSGEMPGSPGTADIYEDKVDSLLDNAGAGAEEHLPNRAEISAEQERAHDVVSTVREAVENGKAATENPGIFTEYELELDHLNSEIDDIVNAPAEIINVEDDELSSTPEEQDETPKNTPDSTPQTEQTPKIPEKITEMFEKLEQMYEENAQVLRDLNNRVHTVEDLINNLNRPPETATQEQNQETVAQTTVVENTPSNPSPETPSERVLATRQQKAAESEEGKEWQRKQQELENQLFEKNQAWVNNPNNETYKAYVGAYDELSRHNVHAWHNDELTKEGAYTPFETEAPKPHVDKPERSILMSGNLYFNQASLENIKDKEIEDIAKTLMWERLKNPAVVDFQFAQGFRINLWEMGDETRRALEEKVLELGGNNYNHIKPEEEIYSIVEEAGNVAHPQTAVNLEVGTDSPELQELAQAQENLEETKKKLVEVEKNLENQKQMATVIMELLKNFMNNDRYNIHDLDKLPPAIRNQLIDYFYDTGYNTYQDESSKEYYVEKRPKEKPQEQVTV